LKKKILIIIILFISISKYVYSNEIKRIIEKLEETKNLKFDFTQTLEKSIETGNCILEFPNKFLCHYNELYGKKILVDNGILYLVDELNIKSSQNINGTPFLFLTDKNQIINALKEIKDFKTNENHIIIRINFSKNEIIDLYFDQKDYLVSGWKVFNYDRTALEFNIKNVLLNLENIGTLSLD